MDVICTFRIPWACGIQVLHLWYQSRGPQTLKDSKTSRICEQGLVKGLHMKSVVRLRDHRMGHHSLHMQMISIAVSSKNHRTRGMGHDDLRASCSGCWLGIPDIYILSMSRLRYASIEVELMKP